MKFISSRTDPSFGLRKISQGFQKRDLRSARESLLKKVPLPEQILVKQVVQVFGTTWPVPCCNNIFEGPLIYLVTTEVADSKVVIKVEMT